MKINKIYPHLTNNFQNKSVSNQNIQENNQYNNQAYELHNQYNDQLIAFNGLRVDKGLQRFFSVNQERMPETIKNFILNLHHTEELSPLEVHAKSFADLDLAKSVEDVKRLFPNEPKFQKIIDPNESRATRGILGTYRENKELFEMCEQGILEDKQNLTVYLLKKIFQEGKTIEEINTSLEKDLDKDFLKIFREKNPDSPFVHSSTIKSLGIEVPDFEYQQSLRFTRDGYSDMMGERISKAQIELWNSLSPEQRTVRAKKTVENFENWWANLSESQKLDKLAEKDNELELLTEYKEARRLERKTPTKTNDEKKVQHTHVGSEKLKKDELFILWAKKNLQIFEESLTNEQKIELQIRRARNMANRWAEMTPAQRTEYIAKMQLGAEPLKYTMIDAWNNSRDIIIDMSEFLKNNKISNPAETIYSTTSFSEHQSEVMTRFWAEHPQHAEKLGKQIQLSHQKVKIALENGTFSKLKQEIAQNRAQRRNDIEFYFNKKSQIEQAEAKKAKELERLAQDYKADFKAAFLTSNIGKIKNLPDKYFDDAYGKILEIMPENLVRNWTRHLRGEQLDLDKIVELQEYLAVETPEIARANRALEATFADILRQYVDTPKIFEMSHSDLKTLMLHIEAKDSGASIISHSNDNMRYDISFKNLNKKISKNEINALYEEYKQDLSKDTIRRILRQFFVADYRKALEMTGSYDDAMKLIEAKQNKLVEYFSTYGKSAMLIFSNQRGLTTAQRNALNLRFNNNIPKEVFEDKIMHPKLLNENSFMVENAIDKARKAFSDKYSFIPNSAMNAYFDEIALGLREATSTDIIQHFIESACHKRTSAISLGRTTCINKENILTETKLKLLAMEQAMADVLYDCTGNEKVYGMEFEYLMDKLELFLLPKKFPTEDVSATDISHENFMVNAKKRPNIFMLKKLYKEYMDDLSERINSNFPRTGDIDKMDIVYALNPEEGNKMKDILVAKRLQHYGIGLSEEDFSQLMN